MKKIISSLVSFVMLFVVAGSLSANEKEFNLIEYLENNKIESHAELMVVLSETSGYPLDRIMLYDLIGLEEQQEISFEYSIDYDNDIVEVDTVYLLAESNSTKSASATRETYSSSGVLIYTVVINGTFSYNSSNCTTTAKSGSYIKGSHSLWNSTPTVTSGNLTTKKAYARIYGEATSLTATSTYSLTLLCDNTGTISSAFTRP